MVSYPLVSLVVLNYNGLKYGHLKTCLESLLKTDYPNYEIIVVDNNSSDGSIEFIRKHYPNISIIKLKKNYGTSVGYMIGALNSKGKYVAILNNDIEVDPNWLKNMIYFMEKYDNIAACDPKFRSYFYRERFEDSAAAGRWIDYFGNNYTRGANEIDRGQYDKPAYILGVLTLFRRNILLRIGGFDPLYVFGYEDIDLAWRLYLAGYKVLYVPHSIIYHKSGGTTRGLSSRIRPGIYYLIKRNRLISIIKNYEVHNMLFCLYVTLIEYYITLLYYTIKGQKAYSRDIFRAILYVFRRLRKIMRLRTRVQGLRRVSDSIIKRYMVPYAGIIYQFLTRK